ncbi:MAG: hypothetical protein NC314_00270 [Roseburia sp.]|nr:hypothetical protein [Roseburia sp.]
MTNLYDKVIKDGKQKQDTRFNTVLMIFIILFVVIFVSFSWILSYKIRYSSFVNKLTGSITYVNHNDSLKVYMDGKTLKLSEDNFTGFNTYLTMSGSGKESKKVPVEEPIIFDYGNGSSLRLWDIPADKYSKRNGVFIQYTDMQGKNYSFISYKITYDTVVTRYLLYDNVEIVDHDM